MKRREQLSRKDRPTKEQEALQQNQTRLLNVALEAGYEVQSEDEELASLYRHKRTDVPKSQTGHHGVDKLFIAPARMNLRRNGSAEPFMVYNHEGADHIDDMAVVRQNDVPKKEAEEIIARELGAQQLGEVNVGVSYIPVKTTVNKFALFKKDKFQTAIDKIIISLSPKNFNADRNPIHISISRKGFVRLLPPLKIRGQSTLMPDERTPLTGEAEKQAKDILKNKFGIELPNRVENLQAFVDAIVTDDSNKVFNPDLLKDYV